MMRFWPAIILIYLEVVETPPLTYVELDLSTLMPFSFKITVLILSVGDGCCFAGTGVGWLGCAEWGRWEILRPRHEESCGFLRQTEPEAGGPHDPEGVVNVSRVDRWLQSGASLSGFRG